MIVLENIRGVLIFTLPRPHAAGGAEHCFGLICSTREFAVMLRQPAGCPSLRSAVSPCAKPEKAPAKKPKRRAGGVQKQRPPRSYVVPPCPVPSPTAPGPPFWLVVGSKEKINTSRLSPRRTMGRKRPQVFNITIPHCGGTRPSAVPHTPRPTSFHYVGYRLRRHVQRRSQKPSAQSAKIQIQSIYFHNGR